MEEEKKEKKPKEKKTAAPKTAKTAVKKNTVKKPAKEPKEKAVRKPRAKTAEKKKISETAEPIVAVETKDISETAKVEAPKETVVEKTAEIAVEKPDVKTVESKPQAAAAPVVPQKIETPKEKAPVKETVAAASPIISAPSKKVVMVHFPITVGDLAQKTNKRVPEIIKALMSIGVFANVNQLLNDEVVFAAAEALDVEIKKEEDEIKEVLDATEKEDAANLKPRPPVVTMMGHVDHGKTSLLDAIRRTNVASREKGFITQHIGAYGVDIPGKGHVTFLDTPGHEAFTAMRARGANATDVVVLVVAADDGVMPQTIEAVDHAREAGCPIVVAMNKIDLPVANPNKVLGELQKIGLEAEEWGGKTIVVRVSAKTGEGIQDLLDMLLLEAEVLELKSNPDRAAVAVVVEGHISKGVGPIATVIVQKGTLKQGDVIVAGPYTGHVRTLKNDRGKNLRSVGPAYSAEVTGLNGVPDAGETIYVVADEKEAKKITEQKILEIRERQMRGAPKHMSLEALYSKISEGNFKELKIILKADVQGSVEALTQSLLKISSDKCQLRVIRGAVGGINESDVMLAAASDAIIIGFHVKADPKAQNLAECEGVDIRFYGIIYEAVEKIRKAMEGILEPDLKEVAEGKIKIRQIFKSSKVGTIGGAIVIKGRVSRQHFVRLVRNNVVLFDGKLSSLKRFKDDVKEVAEGYECGVALEGFNDIQEGDIVEAYRIDKLAAKL